MFWEASYGYIILAGTILIFSVWLRGIRWSYLLIHEKKISVYSLYKTEMIGYFGNNILPFRLGELLRSYIVNREEKISGSMVFGTIVMERLLDTLGLMFFAVLLVLIYPLPEEIRFFIQIGLFILVVLGIVFLLVLYRMRNIKSNQFIIRHLQNFISGFSILNGQLKWKAILISLVLWMTYWMATHLIQMALHLKMDLSESLLVLVISSLALSIPAAPGQIGTFHAAVKYTLITIIGNGKYTPEIGINFALILHVYGYITYTILGAYYFFRSQFYSGAILSVMDNEN